MAQESFRDILGMIVAVIYSENLLEQKESKDVLM